jgi:hypothetical protein
MRVAIIQPLYLPWSGFFEMIASSNTYVALDHVKFEPSSWQSRNRLKGPNGTFLITVPTLRADGRSDRICDRRIDHRQPWAMKHLKSLEFAYKRAPHFDRYYAGIKQVMDGKQDKIADLNISLIRLLMNHLGLDRRIIRSSELPLGDDAALGKNERLIHMMRIIGAKQFYEGALGKRFIDREKFLREGMDVRFQEYCPPVYPQQYGEFAPYISVVDLLFNCGEESLAILRKGVKAAVDW